MTCERCGDAFEPATKQSSTRFCSKTCRERARATKKRSSDLTAYARQMFQWRHGGEEIWEWMASTLEQQDGVCAVCRLDFGKRGSAVDHDHGCCPKLRSCAKCRRGLLCHSCNAALGGFKDNVDTLEAAVAYLRARSSSTLNRTQG